VAGLHEQAMRTGIPFAMDRHAFGKEWCFAVGLRPPEMSGRLEQPVPRMRGDVLEGVIRHGIRTPFWSAPLGVDRLGSRN